MHNLKGSIRWPDGVVGRFLPLDDACVLHEYVSLVAPRYQPSDLPGQSKQYRSQVRRRFRSGVSFTSKKAHEFVALVAQDGILPLQFHLLFPSWCHIVVLLCSSTIDLVEVSWWLWGQVHVHLVHLTQVVHRSRCESLCAAH